MIRFPSMMLSEKLQNTPPPGVADRFPSIQFPRTAKLVPRSRTARPVPEALTMRKPSIPPPGAPTAKTVASELLPARDVTPGPPVEKVPRA